MNEKKTQYRAADVIVATETTYITPTITSNLKKNYIGLGNFCSTLYGVSLCTRDDTVKHGKMADDNELENIQQIFLSAAEIYSHEDNANASNYVDRLQGSLVPFVRISIYSSINARERKLS